MSNAVPILDVRGGQSNKSPEQLSDNQFSKLKNCVVTENNIQSIGGRKKYNSTEILADKGVQSIDWLATGGTTYKVAKCGTMLWLKCGADDWRPIKSGLTEGTRTTFARYGDRLYFADNGLYRWDGFYYTAGVGGAAIVEPAAYDAGTAYSLNEAVLSGGIHYVCIQAGTGHTPASSPTWWRVGSIVLSVGAQWATAGDSTLVKPGDKISLKVSGTWSVQYEVAWVIDDQNLVITTTGPVTVLVPYIISRTHNCGIASPGTAPTLTSAAGSSALDDTAVYKYIWVYYDAVTNKEGQRMPGPVGQITTGTDDGIRIQIDLIPTCPDSYIGKKYVRIYRSDGGGSAYKKLVDILITASTLYYNDVIADASLGSAFLDTTQDAALAMSRTVPTLSLITGAAGIEVGTHGYVYTLWNSITKAESNPSQEATVTVTGGNSVTVSMDMTGCDRQADFVRIYRTTADGVVLKRVDEIAWPGGVTTLTYEDRISDIYTGVGVDPYHDTPPAGIDYIAAINDHIFAWGTTADPEYLYCSSVGNVEYFSSLELGKDDATKFTYPTVGCKIKMGLPGEPITRVCPIGEAYTNESTRANYILVFTRNGSKELWGNDWTDFSRKEGSADGCVSPWVGSNSAGLVAWLSMNGPVIKAPGQAIPTPLYNDIFPEDSMPFSEQVTSGGGTTDYFNLSASACWKKYFIFTWAQTPSTTINRMAMIHIPTGAVTIIGDANDSIKSTTFCVLNGPGDNGEILFGDPDKGTIWQLFAKTGTNTYWDGGTGGVPVVIRYPLIDREGAKSIRLDRLLAIFKKPSATQSVTMSVYENGVTTASSTTGAISILHTGTPNRVEPEYAFGGNGRLVEIEITGTFTVPMTIERLVPSVDLHGR